MARNHHEGLPLRRGTSRRKTPGFIREAKDDVGQDVCESIPLFQSQLQLEDKRGYKTPDDPSEDLWLAIVEAVIEKAGLKTSPPETAVEQFRERQWGYWGSRLDFIRRRLVGHTAPRLFTEEVHPRRFADEIQRLLAADPIKARPADHAEIIDRVAQLERDQERDRAELRAVKALLGINGDQIGASASIRAQPLTKLGAAPTISPHASAVDGFEAVAEASESIDLRGALDQLLGSEFREALVALRQGREMLLFAASPVVGRLQVALRRDPDAKEIVERSLDSLFQDLRRDHEFEHTEVVMALLFAMKEAQSPFLFETVSPIAESRAAEVGRLSRYARTLLK